MTFAISLIDAQVSQAQAHAARAKQHQEAEYKRVRAEFRAKLETIWPELEHAVLVASAEGKWDLPIWNPKWYGLFQKKKRTKLSDILNDELFESWGHTRWDTYKLEEAFATFLDEKFSSRVSLGGCARWGLSVRWFK